MTIKQKVLLLEKPRKEYLSDFEKKFELIYYELSTLEQVIIDFQSKLKDIVAIYGGWGGFSLLGGFRGKLITFAPKHLQIITTCSIGYDHYDVEAMNERGIILTNVPSTIAFEAVADLVLYNAITSFRNFKIFEKNFDGKFAQHTGMLRTSLVHGKFNQFTGKAVITPTVGNVYADSCCGRELVSPRGNNVVIVGFGHIGKLIADRLSCIGMNIHYVKRKRLSQQEEESLNYKVTYHETLESAKDIADLIVIACPGTPSTRHMIDATFIRNMNKQFRIINIGRGFIIDEQALVDGLRSGKVLFAGLDVFEAEPSVHPDLLDRQDVVLTPHIGSSVTENDRYTATTCLSNIETVLSGYNLTGVN
ncbi:putative 2-hydroxyacid dehydrogenase [Spathaspora sp. JA1]|nr:putative 2-hydroxyacid dehydrogenase [Spathaspora sp. JA1]